MGYKTDVWHVRGTVSRNKTQHEEQTAQDQKKTWCRSNKICSSRQVTKYLFLVSKEQNWKHQKHAAKCVVTINSLLIKKLLIQHTRLVLYYKVDFWHCSWSHGLLNSAKKKWDAQIAHHHCTQNLALVVPNRWWDVEVTQILSVWTPTLRDRKLKKKNELGQEKEKIQRCLLHILLSISSCGEGRLGTIGLYWIQKTIWMHLFQAVW